MKHMLRALALALIAALCLSALPALADSYVYVTGDTNIRSGPGLGYKRVGTMFSGDTASYLGSQSADDRGVTWYKISYGSINGWVSSRYAVLNTSGGTNSSFFSNSDASYVKVSGGNANVRSGPGLTYSSLVVMAEGNTASYLNETSTDDRGVAWYKVSFGGVTGWVSSKYARLYAGSASGSGASGVTVSGGDANLRSGPGLGYGQLDVMPNGASATYLGETSTDDRGVAWYKVNYGGTVGWVCSKYAKFSGGASSVSGVKVSGGNANLRSGPGLSYDEVGVMTDGQTASYLGETSVDNRGVAWYKVKFNGKVGWISSKYAKLY